MDSDMMDDSVFDDDIENDSDAFQPEVKAKPKPKAAVAKKPAAKPAAKKMTQTTLKPTKAVPKKRAKPTSDEEDDVANGSGFSNTPPSNKKQKKAPAAKKSAGIPLDEIENDSMNLDGPPDAKSKKTATETYQKLTQLEHILKRPDTYIGSVERTEQPMWVFNKEAKRMEFRKVGYVPGLYKIFDEILVNAADNKQRDSKMSFIKVTINREAGEITVENNGKGIPVEVHEKERVYIPELVFGHLLAGSNFDDDEKKTVGGRNGFGAKLCNVFSTEFNLECQDSKNGKRYKQTWRKNMSVMEKAKITANKSSDFVRVIFKPDFSKFSMPNGIDDDLEAMLIRRVYDMAGVVRGVKVYLNDEHLKMSFSKYCEMYAKAIAAERGVEEGTDQGPTVILEDSDGHPRWEIAFAVSDGSFQQVSFVNSIATTQGGTHVNYIADKICQSLLKNLDKKKKGHSLKLNHIRNHIFIFVNCLVDNPAFTSQTKEQLTTKASQFGSKCELTDKFLTKIGKTDAITNILHFAEQKADKMLAKSDGNKRSRISNDKLVDANLAGSKFGHQCTLILTEGDSAKSLAVAGRAILDPDRIGVFPLRGKMLNVRDASIEQISKNSEIQNIKQFLGLKHKQTYTDAKSLRYGHLMIMADQDHDGSHIKGLLINFLQVQYPSLLLIDDFFQEFITPIVKVWQGPNPKKPLRLKSFFTQPEYEEWKDSHKAEMKRWNFKYFKGLGTSSNEDAQVYFTNLDVHLREFRTMQTSETELLELAFSKKKADARKEWLGNFVPGTYLDHSSKSITYTDFVNRELILFSMADNMRSIPSMLDGFKPGQRKVIYACLKRNLVKDKKVIELAGYVSEQTAYHHGEASLQQTIIGLAQDFVGSNNINCLEPSGNFGSRLAGGSDAASARYIHTRLSPFARKIFSPLDEPNLEHWLEDGKKIEPKVYAPILPMVLVNGADGIGTGWSTNIPNYHPMDIVRNLRRRMGRADDGEEKPFESMMPWFRGWKGSPREAGVDRYQFDGIASGDESRNEVIITELPIRMWTNDFKAKLEEVIRGEKTASWIKDYKEFNDHQNVHFEIQMDEKSFKQAQEVGFLEKFKLLKQVPTSNLVAFDSRGMIRKYEKVEDIMEEFYVFRLRMYKERKAHWLGVYHGEYRKLKNQARFIREIMDNELVVSRKKKAVIVEELRDRKYEAFPRNVENVKTKSDEENAEAEAEAEADQAEEDGTPVSGAGDYDYLLGMPIWSFTQERLDKLKDQIVKKKVEHDELEALSEKDLWVKDLDEFEVEWENQLRLEAEISTSIRRMGRRASKKIGAGGKGRKVKDDDDYAPVAKSRPAAKATKPTVVERKTQESFAAKFTAKSQKRAMGADAANDDSDAFSDDDYAALKSSHSKRPAVPTTSKPSTAPPEEDMEMSETVAPANVRSKRAAASKAKTWIVEDDSDEDTKDFDGGIDIGDLVKGIPGGDASSGESKNGRVSLFAMSGPESSNGVTATSKSSKSKPSNTFDLDSHDDTNYEMLAKPSPHKTAARDEIDELLSDDDDDVPPTKSASRAKTSSTALSEEPKPAVKKPRGRPAGTTKAKTAVAATKKVAAKPVQLSPAAKMYAKKKAEAPRSKKDPFGMSDDDVDEDDDLAEPASPVSKPATKGRPGRAAATKKKQPAYKFSDDEEDEVEEPADDDDDEDSDPYGLNESDD